MNGSGRVVMVIAVILMSAFIFLRNLRQLEFFGDFGVIMVLIMVTVIMVSDLLPCNALIFSIPPNTVLFLGFRVIGSRWDR